MRFQPGEHARRLFDIGTHQRGIDVLARECQQIGERIVRGILNACLAHQVVAGNPEAAA